MEGNEVNAADIIRSIRVSYKSGASKRYAKPSSVELYYKLLLCYDVHLACDICIHINENTHKCGLRRLSNHKCSQNRLVLFAKNSNTTDSGDLLRARPAGYNPMKRDQICEHLTLKEPCLERHLCPYPHTDVEQILWKQDYSDATSIASLACDLRESSLMLSVAIQFLSKKFSGTFKLICTRCLQLSHEVTAKHHHVPWCKAPDHHHWSSCKKLVFEMVSDSRLIDVDEHDGEDVDEHDEHDGEEKELFRCVKLLREFATVDDIAAEAARLQQAQRSARNATVLDDHRPLCHYEPFDSESDNGDNDENHYVAKTDDEIFDEDASYLLNDAAFDADTGDSKDTRPSNARVRGTYYELLTEEQTQDDPDVICAYGTIKLLGAFRGICVIVGGELDGREVELHGRMNCGPAFDGDEVRVKVYKKCKKKYSASGSAQQFHGSVVDVVKRNIHRNRTARTFVCTVGRHSGNLMTPLCGSAPKFRVMDSCLVKRYGHKGKQNYVAVYDSDLRLRKTVRLDLCRRKEMLFVVKYLKWELKCKYPLGYVCSILHESCTDKESQKVLNQMHELRCNEDTELEAAVDEFDSHNEAAEREDMCKLLTVSIDQRGTRYVDDALSLEESSGNFVVWIHVADVTHYLQKDDCVDLKAQHRLLSFGSAFPRQTVQHMLPEKFAEKWSLLENSCRRALSMCFELTVEGEVLNQTGPVASWISNDKQLYYDIVQEIIDDPSDGFHYDCQVTEDTEHMLIRLHKLATVLRKRRLQDASHYYEYCSQHCFNREGIEDPFDIDQNNDACRLVEEFMILTNQYVGRMLRQKCPDCTPFLVQEAPKDTLLKSWKTNHSFIMPFSFYFESYKQYLGDENSSAKTLLMLQKCWDAILGAVENGDTRKVRTIIGSELVHPLHSIALSSWFSIQEPSQYMCNDGVHDLRHFSLQTSNYVQFTSPLRRYTDVVVHRLLKVSATEPPPYTQHEVVELCEKMNDCRGRQRQYDHECGLLKMASMLQMPIYIPCYVDSIDESGICLASPYFPSELPYSCRLYFNEMTLCDNPKLPSTGGGKVTLNWSKRYYDTKRSETTNARSDSVTDYVLDSSMFCMKVSPNVWHSMHEAIKGQPESLLPSVWEAMRASSPVQQEVCDTVREVTSEMVENQHLVRHHVKFSCDIARGTVLSVQFGAKTVKGVLQPVVKLVNLTHDKDICVEHQRDPVHALSSVTTKKAKDAYRDIEEYQKIWRAILAMEAATDAVRSNESIVCSNVPVEFFTRNDIIYGQLKLSKEFCDKRFIKIYTLSEEETHDYMCIRYFLKKRRCAKSFTRNVWVVHATVVSCRCTGGDIQLTVKCNCTKNKPEPPPELFINASTVHCTIEFLQRCVSHK